MGKWEQQAKGESQVKNYVISRARTKVCNAFWFSCHSDAQVGRGSSEWWCGGGRRTMWPTLSIMFMALPQNDPHPSTRDLCKWSPREHFHNSQTTHTIWQGIYKEGKSSRIRISFLHIALLMPSTRSKATLLQFYTISSSFPNNINKFRLRIFPSPLLHVE